MDMALPTPPTTTTTTTTSSSTLAPLLPPLLSKSSALTSSLSSLSSTLHTLSTLTSPSHASHSALIQKRTSLRLDVEAGKVIAGHFGRARSVGKRMSSNKMGTAEMDMCAESLDFFLRSPPYLSTPAALEGLRKCWLTLADHAYDKI
eukprot:CAMPEP_0182463110 /NCGR_PEP_ID=MMETSP1319-20130603/7147_1 /TAXON_ID=172717 /ORGANISM="Bolidomonas pacifica, Strain RCC208" /LENGTH=146 /DNA_ID=CAMNT_0024662617 /DNA_START=176 /DNA_END=613 /DNA_ORIENTATION=+